MNRMHIKNFTKTIVFVIALLSFTACGGGGGGMSEASVPSSTVSDQNTRDNAKVPDTIIPATLSLLVIVSQDANNSLSGDAATAVQHAVDYANIVHDYSGTGVDYRISTVLFDKYNATVEPDMLQTLRATAPESNTQIAQLRDAYKADIVVSVIAGQPYVDGTCGIAYLGQLNRNVQPNVYYDGYFAAVANIDPIVCGDMTLVHELGHTVGLNHDEIQDGINNDGAIEQYARGYGVYNDFVTVMAYPSSYNVQNSPEPVFSTPDLLCGQNDLPCGVDKNDPHGADAVDIFRNYGKLLDVR